MANSNSLLETERTILAVLLNDSHAIIPVMDVLDGEAAFLGAKHRAAYRAILELTKAGIVPNIHTVAERAPELTLEDLQDIARRFNTKANKEVVYLAGVVDRAGKRRQIAEAIKAAAELVEQEETDDIEGLAVLAGTMVTGSIDTHSERDPHISAVTKRLDDEVAQLNSGDGLIGFDTGSAWLNDKTGGMCSSHVWIISAPYKGRKTTLARNLVIEACKAGAMVDVFALEGSQEGTSAGLLAMLATDRLFTWGCGDEMVLSETWVRRGNRTQAQHDALSEARKELDGYRLRIYDARDRISTPERITHIVKRDRFMFGLNVFVLDYLQLLGQGKLFDRVEEGTHALQQVIGQEAVTGIILAQLNEATIFTMGKQEESYSPGVKGGGDPAAAADYLIRTKYDGEKAPDDLIVQLKLARHASPGSQKYLINRESGRILAELESAEGQA